MTQNKAMPAPCAELKELYTQAFDLYERQEYEQASKYFKVLTAHEPQEKHFWMGLGAAEKMRGAYPEAAQSFAAAALLDQKNGDAYFHAAECFIEMGEYRQAEEALRGAEAYTTDPEVREKIARLQQEVRS